ncbi:hypothetical protein MKX07_004637 [Trichoderma sp. CBMAI-0711]|nr:hypothetical protein MKX07_004637 [Trichoderma sp. CBMAI-0711]
MVISSPTESGYGSVRESRSMSKMSCRSAKQTTRYFKIQKSISITTPMRFQAVGDRPHFPGKVPVFVDCTTNRSRKTWDWQDDWAVDPSSATALYWTTDQPDRD